MAISINLGSGAGSTNGDTLYDAFTKINNMFSTTTKLTSGDLQINGVNIGQGALVTTNFNNTAIGFQAGALNTAGTGNTALGTAALKENISNSSNTAVGTGSLQFTKGDSNTAIGAGCLTNNIGGNNNIAIGLNASFNSVSVSYNTALGTIALANNTTRSNCTGLGHNAQVSADNQVRLGDTSTTTLSSSGTANFSDIRDKADVRDTILGLDFVNSLRAVDYKWDYREDYRTDMPSPLGQNATEQEKDAHKIIMDEWLESCKFSNLVPDGSKKRTRYHHGLIAQEVQDVIEASGVDFGGFQDHTVGGGDEVMTITYTELIAPMIKAIQELTARINVLEGN
jgi:hypothetical protein